MSIIYKESVVVNKKLEGTDPFVLYATAFTTLVEEILKGPLYSVEVLSGLLPSVV